MKPVEQVERKNPTAPDEGAGAGAGLGVTPARFVNRRVIADANKARMFMEYASMTFASAREAYERGDYETAEFCWKLARFCLDKSDYYLFRYFAKRGWW